MKFHEARARALARELGADPSILLIDYHFGPSNPRNTLPSDFPNQLIEGPLCEFGTSATAVGAAIAGLRPVVFFGTSSFMFYAWSAIVCEASNVRYQSGDTVSAPVVFHCMAGSRHGGGPQHQHTPQSMLQNVPGLRLLAPATPSDVDAVFHVALTGNDPTVIIDNNLIFDVEGEVDERPCLLQPASIEREGTDVAIVAYSRMTHLALATAEDLQREGVSVAVINVPLLSPAPVDLLAELLTPYDRIIFLDESRAAGCPASHWMARLSERTYENEQRWRLVCTRDAPTPFAPHLADAIEPSVRRVRSAILELLE